MSGADAMQVESLLNDFVRLHEESSYHEPGMTVEGGQGVDDLMASDEENYQLGGCSAVVVLWCCAAEC